MKKSTIRRIELIALIGIIFAISFVHCTEPTKVPSSIQHSYPDTTWVTINYAFDWNKNDYREVTSKMIIRDTVKEIITDSSNGKRVTEKKRVIDSTFYVPLLVYTDSAGRQYPDSVAHTKQTLIWLPANKQLILEYYIKDWYPMSHH